MERHLILFATGKYRTCYVRTWMLSTQRASLSRLSDLLRRSFGESNGIGDRPCQPRDQAVTLSNAVCLPLRIVIIMPRDWVMRLTSRALARPNTITFLYWNCIVYCTSRSTYDSAASIVSRVLRPARYITVHFGDESFQAITCTGTDNTKQTGENTPKTSKTQNKQTDPR